MEGKKNNVEAAADDADDEDDDEQVGIEPGVFTPLGNVNPYIVFRNVFNGMCFVSKFWLDLIGHVKLCKSET